MYGRLQMAVFVNTIVVHQDLNGVSGSTTPFVRYCRNHMIVLDRLTSCLSSQRLTLDWHWDVYRSSSIEAYYTPAVQDRCNGWTILADVSHAAGLSPQVVPC